MRTKPRPSETLSARIAFALRTYVYADSISTDDPIMSQTILYARVSTTEQTTRISGPRTLRQCSHIAA